MSDYRAAWLDPDDAAARTAYAALHASSPNASASTCLDFADAVVAAFGWPGRIALVYDAEPVPAAGLLVFEKRHGPFRAAALPPYGEYVTPLLREHHDDAAAHRRDTPLDALLTLLDTRVDQATMNLSPSLYDTRPFAWQGWTLTPRFRYVLPLEGDPTTRFNTAARRTLRRHAASYSLLVNERALLDDVLTLEAGSLKRQGLTPSPRSALRILADRALDANIATLFALRSNANEKIEAGMVVLHDASRGRYWIVGSQPGPSMTMLVAQVADWLGTRGCTHFCLGGANVPGVAEFKRRLGGELERYERARRVSSRLLRLRDAFGEIRGDE